MRNQYIKGELRKKGAWTVRRFKGGLDEKEGVAVFEGWLIPQCTLWGHESTYNIKSVSRATGANVQRLKMYVVITIILYCFYSMKLDM